MNEPRLLWKSIKCKTVLPKSIFACVHVLSISGSRGGSRIFLREANKNFGNF